MQISPHFTLAELTVSDTAKRLGLDNTPKGALLDRLILNADRLEKVRELLGGPILVTSGYRSPAVNKAVGGVSNSDHMNADAFDFTCPSFGSPYDVALYLSKNLKSFDQIIHERRRWVHLSFGPKMRKELLTLPVKGNKYLKGIIP